jgi:hypothetical protein
MAEPLSSQNRQQIPFTNTTNIFSPQKHCLFCRFPLPNAGTVSHRPTADARMGFETTLQKLVASEVSPNLRTGTIAGLILGMKAMIGTLALIRDLGFNNFQADL